jgi:hypothetical protein
MARNWWAIAKAEFLVQTSRLRPRRREVSVLLVLFGFIWALYLAPLMMSAIVTEFAAPMEAMLMVALPGIMRSVILLLWVLVLVYPIIYSLQEIKIGQWEIMLSNNVSTRDMLIGTFVGKLPTYGLTVLFIAPVLMYPFIQIFQVPLLGQLIIYAVVFVIAIVTVWFSNIISTAIQAKLGDSERGNDIAKGLGMLMAVIFLIPLYGLMYFAGPLSEIMGLDVFVILPSTWGADLITWTVILQNGINLDPVVIGLFETFLTFPAIIDTALVGLFAVFTIALGFGAADRLFTFQGGARTETVVTVGGENVFIRGIRRMIPGSFGTLVALTMKEFSRKVQNMSRVIYGVVLASIFPVILFAGLPSDVFLEGEKLFMSSIMVSMMLGMICGLTFGSIGFLESKDQLWIIRSAPRGSSKFIKARVVESMILGIPLAIIPSITTIYIVGLGIVELLIMVSNTYVVLFGSILVSIGVTASNPAYENTKSSAFYVNTFVSIFIIMGFTLAGLIIGLIQLIVGGAVVLTLYMISIPLVLVGILILAIGATRLARPDS